MAGNLFPETYIGDSEDAYKKAPGGKKKNPSPLSRDVQPGSPPRADAGQPNSGAGAGELQEVEEEKDRGGKEPPGGNAASPPAARSSSPEEPGPAGACEGPEVLWPPPGDDTHERLEPRLNEVSLIDNFGPEEKLPTTGTGRSTPGGPESRPADPQDEENPPGLSPASTGYFPCYRTYVELPRYRPPSADGQPEGAASCRDAGVKCHQPESTARAERKKADANSNSKGGKASLAAHGSPRRPREGGSRPGSASTKRDSSGRNPKAHGGGSPEGLPKARPSGGSPNRPGVARDEPVPCPRASRSPPPTAHKKKNRASPAGDQEPGEAAERKPLLADLRSLPPSPEEKAGVLPLCCYYGAQAERENQPVKPLKEQKKEEQLPDPSSAPDLSGDPRPSPSRLSFHAIVSWVWRIFRKPPPSPPPATTPGTEAIRRPLAHRVRLWLAQRRGRVRPETPR
ncbi:hypothetical protein JRQ81_008802 [Phrynocephalus forsythii]|uniref:Uncharacterized protein n=1 Tax=Phrynocephalus forsythii TaxID=171643 RepID=A0A9Q0XAW8_9SAUR|nr:hypothetical protein JRQ81_008802 [Phrynocephalus forsythii]